MIDLKSGVSLNSVSQNKTSPVRVQEDVAFSIILQHILQGCFRLTRMFFLLTCSCIEPCQAPLALHCMQGQKCLSCGVG